MPHRWNDPQIFRQATTPTDSSGPEPVAVGDLWLDTGTPQLLRHCTSISPITFASVEGATAHAQDTDIVVVTFFVETPVATDDQAFHRVPFAATLLQVDYLCVGGTNWVGQVQEADANGLNAVDTQTTDTTASAGTNAQVTSFSNSGLDAGDYLKLKSTSISGTPTSLVVTVQYRKT